MRRIGLLPLGLGLIASTSTADTYPRQPGVDAIHYVFRLTLDDDRDAIEGEATADVRFVQDGLPELALDLATDAGGKGMTVTEVRSEGAPVRFRHEEDRLHILLDSPPGVGIRKPFVIRYRGVPAAGLRIGKNKHGERTFFSDNWPDKARQWLPTIDHPSDKATSEFVVTAPARYQVVSNGLLQEETDLGDGRRRTHWKQSVPIASWLNALGVAQFAAHHAGTVRGVPLQTWVYHQDRDAGLAALEGPARRALEFYSDTVGPYPYEKLGGVQAAGVVGGMELASAVFYGERSITGRPATNLVAHEVAHQWFGDSVTERDWDEVWLSEGFATYLALLFIEHDRGRDAFVAGLKRSRAQVLAFERRNPGVAVIHDHLADMRKVLNPLVYQKGAWTLHMLRTQVGTDAFRAGLRDYYRRHRDGNASTDDFRRAMEAASGADLAGFFRQWLTRAGSPVLEGTWWYDPAARRVEVELAQEQPGDPYRLRLEVGLTVAGKAGPRVETIELTGQRQRFEIAADEEPASVVLDPNTSALMEARFGKRPGGAP